MNVIILMLRNISLELPFSKIRDHLPVKQQVYVIHPPFRKLSLRHRNECNQGREEKNCCIRQVFAPGENLSESIKSNHAQADNKTAMQVAPDESFEKYPHFVIPA